jgi:hypothetical protein
MTLRALVTQLLKKQVSVPAAKGVQRAHG